MMPELPGLTFVVGDAETIERMRTARPLVPFSDEAVGFLDALSKRLFASGRGYPDVVTFAFWCRKGAVLRERKRYEADAFRLGRGIAFHSTPSNVAVNFAFSFATGLLAGNPNIVRLPARDFPQVTVISNAVRETLSEIPAMKPYVAFVRYGLVKECSDYFSSICASRIVWGGDQTIAMMRQSSLPPRAVEVTFADRYSLLVLDADAVMALPDMKNLVRAFWNDTYLTDQNACTAPRLIVWMGKDKAAAKERFWRAVHALVKSEYGLKPVQSVGKLAAFYRAAAAIPGMRLVESPDNFITRVSVPEFAASLMDFKYNSGFFFELDADDLSAVFRNTSVKCQTVTQFGMSREVLAEALKRSAPQGIDRIVSVGASMDFSLIWDGYDLIRTLSRVVTVG